MKKNLTVYEEACRRINKENDLEPLDFALHYAIGRGTTLAVLDYLNNPDMLQLESKNNTSLYTYDEVNSSIELNKHSFLYARLVINRLANIVFNKEDLNVFEPTTYNSYEQELVRILEATDWLTAPIENTALMLIVYAFFSGRVEKCMKIIENPKLFDVQNKKCFDLSTKIDEELCNTIESIPFGIRFKSEKLF